MADDSNRYPLSRTRFRVEIDGLGELDGWVAVKGLTFGSRTSEMYGQHTQNAKHLPGKRVAGPITLVRHFDQNTQLADWAREGPRKPLNGSVIFLNYVGEESRRFNWSAGWVSNYDPGEFDATPESEGPALERVVITVEDIFPG